MLYDLGSFIAIFAVWFVLMRFVLPALGLPTCCSGACDVRRPEKKEKETDVRE